MSIQKYSLGEIGIFFKTIVQCEQEEKKEFLTHLWMGSNLGHKDLKEVLQGMNSSRDNEGPTDREVNNDWKRLASFMAGKT